MNDAGINTVEKVLATKNEAIIAQAIAEGAIRNPTLLGAGTEKLIRDAVSSYLPSRFSVSSGALVGAQGEISSQTDLVIFDGHHAVQPATSINLIPCESSVAVVEVKRSLRSSQLKKSIADALIIKTMQRHKTELLEEKEDGSAPSIKAVRMPFFTHCSLATILEQDSLSLIAQKWHHQYFDVPFGCQLDSIVCLQKGMITLASWQPDLGYPRNHYSPVYSVQLFEEVQDGRSIILFPDFFSGNKQLRVRITPRLNFQVGTAFFLAETHYGEYSLAAWLHFLASWINGLLSLNGERLATIGDFYNIAVQHHTKFTPLAIAVDANKFAEKPDYTIQEGVKCLLSWNNQSTNEDERMAKD